MSILDSDAFLDMPQSTQNLYMHMAMRADDDGFLGNAKKIMRMTNCGEDDYKVLVAKKFILPFESGICVIKHWLIHNTIRKDRYEETTYLDEKKGLNTEENKAYSVGLPSGNHVATIGTPRREENSIEEKRTVKKFGELKNVSIKEDEYAKLCKKYGTPATDRLIEELSTYMASQGKRYKSHYATLLNWAKRKNLDMVKITSPSIEEEITPEQLSANKRRIEKMKANMNFKI